MLRTERISELGILRIGAITGSCSGCGAVLELTPFDFMSKPVVICKSCRVWFDLRDILAAFLADQDADAVRDILERAADFCAAALDDEDLLNED